MTDLPTVITATGVQPTDPSVLRSNTVTYAQAESPGITTDLPGTLIEDLASTSTGALVQIDQAKVDAINSVTPLGVNDAMLDQMGYIYGVTRNTTTNTSAYVIFTGTPGMVINPGFTVSDGTNAYATQEAATLDSNGLSGNVYVVATSTGSWAVPAGSITKIETSIPSKYTLTVTNAATGTPGSDAETSTSYRYRVIQSGAVSCQSTPRFLKSSLANVNGVNSRLISVNTASGGIRVMVGGGDPYQIAGAIYQSVADITSLIGSTNSVTSVSKAVSGVVTTKLTHGLSDGQQVVISGAQGMTEVNGTWIINVLTNNSFSIGLNTTSLSDYTGSGILETNPRNETVSIFDTPDSYSIPFVIPLQQLVRVVLTWNTSSVNTVSEGTVQTLGVAALVSYINSIASGAPINLYQMQSAFSTAISNVVTPAELTRMDFTVYIDGEEATETTGTGVIQGDAESYLYTTSTDITINRG